jgi:hemoglobin
MISPFEEMGGEETIERVLDDLYTQLFDDVMVAFLFAGHDKARIVREQTVFTRRMLGDKTARYEGKSIPEAHAELPILPGHFDRRHELLRQTLEKHAVPLRAREAWLRLDAALRDVILKVGQVRIEELRWRGDDE